MIFREALSRFLNQGRIPTWEEYLIELPELDDDALENAQNYYHLIIGMKFIEEHIHDDLTELLLHSPTNSQKTFRNGQKMRISFPISEADWQIFIEALSIKFTQSWNNETPFVSFHGTIFHRDFRISLIHFSTSPERVSKIFLRSLAPHPYPLKSFSNEEVLQSFVKNKKNVLIAGATGSGKTSLLASLSQEIPEEDHVIILEDTYEIMTSAPHHTRFLSNEKAQNSLKSFLSYSLRLTPDRIILGEMRSNEVIPYLLAMNTGHKGLMSTVHASSAIDALNRVALLFCLYSGNDGLNYSLIMDLLCRNLDHVIFMENKQVKEVIQILGSDKGVPYFERVV